MGKTVYTDDDLILKKSNALLNAKFKASDMENDIMNIAMTRIESAKINDKDFLVARLYPADINTFVHKGKNIYRELKTAAKLLTGHTMLIETPDAENNGGSFHAFAIITDVSYSSESGVLEIRFSEHLRTHLFDLTSHYATENIALITMLKGYAKRIYEILNEHKYKIKTAPDGVYSVVYRLNEFRFMIGLANIDESGVQRYIARNDAVDWDELYDSIAKEKIYPIWQKLKEKILIPAQKELKEKADICFEFEGLREGRSIKKIRFDIMKNTPSVKWTAQAKALRKNLESKSSDEYKQTICATNNSYKELYEEFLGHNQLTVDDIDVLMKKADYDEECVRTAIKMADRQDNITNYMGWLVSCIERGYASPIEVIEGDAKKAERVKEVREEYEENREDVATRAWNKIKQKDDYPEFVESMKSKGILEESFDIVFTPEEMTKFYTEWKIKKRAF